MGIPMSIGPMPTKIHQLAGPFKKRLQKSKLEIKVAKLQKIKIAKINQSCKIANLGPIDMGIPMSKTFPLTAFGSNRHGNPHVKNLPPYSFGLIDIGIPM